MYLFRGLSTLSLSLSLSVALLAGSLFFANPAYAVLYAPGETLDPACAPTDVDCGVETVGEGTTGQIPYYAGNGAALTSTSTISILSSGYVGIGTTTPISTLAVSGTTTANGFYSTLAYGGYRFVDTTTPGNGINIVGGYSGNSIASGYIAATIAGGGTSGGTNEILSTTGTSLAYSFIGGGYDNKMDSAFPSVITGGGHNRINMSTGAGFTTQVSYTPNTATDHSTISGGTYNAIYNTRYGTIGGGSQNALGHLGSTTDNAVIAGGTTNKINGQSSVIGGGSTNTVVGQSSVIAGGILNSTSGGNSIFLGGGSTNSINSGFATLGGGTLNTIAGGGTTFGTYAVLGGGLSNSIGGILQSQYGVIIGGRSNTINGDYSVVLGGRDNVASSSYNVVAGRRAKATASGVFAFSDSTDSDFTVSTANTFGARFSGGYQLTGGNVGISSTTPWRTLSVNGTVALNGLTSSATGNTLCITTTKDITDAGGGTCTPSSERFKEHIETLGEGFALEELNKLRVVSFDYKSGFYSPEDAPGSYGLIAEEVEQIDPLLVDYGYDGKPLTLKFEKFIGLAIQAIQELSAKVNILLGHFPNSNTLCVGSTCITESQLQELLEDSNQDSAFTPTPASPEPPADDQNLEIPPSGEETADDTTEITESEEQSVEEETPEQSTEQSEEPPADSPAPVE
jgi:hypothetical protein